MITASGSNDVSTTRTVGEGGGVQAHRVETELWKSNRVLARKLVLPETTHPGEYGDVVVGVEVIPGLNLLMSAERRYNEIAFDAPR